MVGFLFVFFSIQVYIGFVTVYVCSLHLTNLMYILITRIEKRKKNAFSVFLFQKYMKLCREY